MRDQDKVMNIRVEPGAEAPNTGMLDGGCACRVFFKNVMADALYSPKY